MTKKVRSVPVVFRAVHFGNEILSRRLELGLSAAQVAVMLPFTESALYGYERGDTPNLKMQHFLAACNIYDLNPCEFFELDIK